MSSFVNKGGAIKRWRRPSIAQMLVAVAVSLFTLGAIGASPAVAESDYFYQVASGGSFQLEALRDEDLQDVRGVGVDPSAPVSSQNYEELSIILWDELNQPKPQPSSKQNGQVSSSISGSLQ